MQRKLTKLSVLSTLSILAIAGLGQSSLSISSRAEGNTG